MTHLLGSAARTVFIILLCAFGLAATSSKADDQSAHVKSFIEAAERGDLNAVNAALKAGVDVNATLKHGWTALHAAAERSRVKVLKRLIEAGANVNAKEYLEVTPLHLAAIRGPREAVKALIQAGADVDAYCVQHDTPLRPRCTSPQLADGLMSCGC